MKLPMFKEKENSRTFTISEPKVSGSKPDLREEHMDEAVGQDTQKDHLENFHLEYKAEYPNELGHFEIL